jgi:inorganic triphosphatase YgiF
MPVEVELKFRAESDAPLVALTRADRLGEARLGPPISYDEDDRYLDTADGRLAAARWACRLRRRGGIVIASLKGPAELVSPDGMHRRPEVEGPAAPSLDPRDWPSSAARDLVLRVTDGASLEEFLRLRQRRTERAVEDGGGRLGTLSLDRVDVERDARRVERLLVVELELTPEADGGDVAGLAEALTAVDGLQPDPRTKLEHALSALNPARR